MITDQRFWVLGAGWVSALGYGVFGSEPRFANEDVAFQYPELSGFIAELPARYGRFDVYSKLCFATAVLALQDAGMLQREGKKRIGIVVGSSSGVYDNDLAYFESTKEEKGAFTSPNLFSYTLPNVALGEIAVFFNCIGPSCCVGNDPGNPGYDAMPVALSLLESGQCDVILAGWVEVAHTIKNHAAIPKGAALAVLSAAKTSQAKAGFVWNQPVCFAEIFHDQEKS